MPKQLVVVFAGLLIVGSFLSAGAKAQTGLVDPRTSEYVCVLSRTVNYTTDQNVGSLGTVKANGTIVVLPCEAADVRQDGLVDADYTALERMQLERILFETLRTRPNSEAEARNTRADFQKLAQEVCARHPKIALLPLSWKSEQSSDKGDIVLKTCSAYEKSQ